MDPQERAQRATALMWSNDRVSQDLGFELVAVAEGYAKMRLTVTHRHCNGHGTLHGGILCTFADSTSGFASNSRNQTAVSAHNHISYVAPAKPGDVLVAEAREVSLAGRNGIYDVMVRNHNGAAIAHFTGMTRIIPGQFFDE